MTTRVDEANVSACNAADILRGLGSTEVLNSKCFCISLDSAALRKALESEIG